MNIPIELLTMFVALSFAVGILGIILALKKIAGSPFIIMFAGILLFSQLAIITNIEGVSDDRIESIINNSTTHMNQPTSTVSIALRSGSVNFLGEEVVNDNSALNGDTINQITVRLDKDGNPTGDFYVGIWNSIQPATSTNYKFIVGQMKANHTDLTGATYTFTRNDTKTYVLQVNDAIGVFYNGGSVGNAINMHENATVSSFDGANSIRTAFTGSTMAWTDQTTRDIRGKIALLQTNLDVTYEKYPFNQNDAYVFFILFGALFILISVMAQVQKW